MAITQRNEAGELLVLTDQGWRRATPQEDAAQGMSRTQQFGMGFLQNMGSYASLLETVGNANVRLQSRGEVQAQPSPELAAFNQSLQPIQEAYPGATQAGRNFGDPFNQAALVSAGGSLARRTMAARVQEKIAQQSAQAGSRAEQAAAATAGQAGADAGLGNVPGFGGVGAGSTREPLIRRMIRSPGQFYDDLKQGVDEFLSPEQLTPDQAQMLPVGEKLGFRFLPGQREGAQGIRQLATSDPVVAGAFAPELAANRLGLRRAAARAIGVQADDFSRDLLGAAADQVDEAMRATGAKIGTVTLDDDLKAAVEMLKGEEKFLSLPAEASYTGDQLVSLRSNLNAASRAAWQQGAQAPAGKAEFIDSTISRIDDLIEARLSEGDMAIWRSARQRWKNVKVLESSGAIVNEAGEINHRSLANAMRRMYKGAYGRQVTGEAGRRAGLDQATQEFMDWTRLANQFGDNFPNSGTAYRNRLVQVMTQPKELAKSLMLRAAIESQVP